MRRVRGSFRGRSAPSARAAPHPLRVFAAKMKLAGFILAQIPICLVRSARGQDTLARAVSTSIASASSARAVRAMERKTMISNDSGPMRVTMACM